MYDTINALMGKEHILKLLPCLRRLTTSNKVHEYGLMGLMEDQKQLWIPLEDFIWKDLYVMQFMKRNKQIAHSNQEKLWN
jgi:hypothetical protein